MSKKQEIQSLLDNLREAQSDFKKSQAKVRGFLMEYQNMEGFVLKNFEALGFEAFLDSSLFTIDRILKFIEQDIKGIK